MNKIYISKLMGETKVAGVNVNGELVYYNVERFNKKSRVGQICFAKVKEINKSLSLAYLSSKAGDVLLNNIGSVSEGEIICVQIIRDGFLNKMPAAKTRLSIKTRYFEISTSKSKINYHKTIGRGRMRAELELKIVEICADELGVTVLSACKNLNFNHLKAVFLEAREKFDTLINKIETSAKEKLEIIRPAVSICQNMVLNCENLGQIVVDDMANFNELQSLINSFDNIQIKHLSEGELGGQDLFTKLSIADKIDDCLVRTLPLEGGGSIVIDRTEALIAIDVNGGGLSSLNSADEAVFRLNKRAARQIAKQIVLRNLCGLIVVDFVSIKNRGMQKQLPKILSAALNIYDANGVFSVMGLTNAGLVEITRKRTRAGLDDILLKQIEDRPLTNVSAGLEVLNKIIRQRPIGEPVIFAPKDVIDCLNNGELKDLKDNVEKTLCREITFEVSDNLAVDIRKKT